MLTPEIRRVPLRHGIAVSDFLSDAAFALHACTNLRSFTFTSESDVLPSFLKPLIRLEHLTDLRLRARLTTAQAELLAQTRGLRSLTLEYASWNVLDLLPAWAGALRGTLRTLTIHVRRPTSLPRSPSTYLRAGRRAADRWRTR